MATKLTKTPLPHHVRAANLAHTLFEAPSDHDDTLEATRNVSFTVPLGMLLACDVLAKRGGMSRSSMASQLMSLGFGLVLEQMTPAQRTAIHKVIEAEDKSPYMKGKLPPVKLEVVEG
jgi:hypothetical protein